MKARLIAGVSGILCALPIAGDARQLQGKIEVSEGPTPFIRFVNTSVSDVAGFKFA